MANSEGIDNHLRDFPFIVFPSGHTGGHGVGGLSGETAGGIGGKGEEFHYQHVGKVCRFEEGGDRKGGIGVDSSEEKLETEGIDRSMSVGLTGWRIEGLCWGLWNKS